MPATLLGFTAKRFIGTFLTRYVPAARLLAIHSLLDLFLVLPAVVMPGKLAVYLLVGIEFFIAIIFLTIFSLGIRGLGAANKESTSLLIMAIVGGAAFPVLMGRVSDASNIRTAYVVPAVCFLVVLYFALRNAKVRHLTLSTAH